MEESFSSVAADLRRALARVSDIEVALGPVPVDPEAGRQYANRTREWWNEGGPSVEHSVDVTFKGPTRRVPAALYRAKQTRTLQPAFVYLHGGAFRIGHPRWNDRQMRELACLWGGTIISIDYAHVPEAVFPAAILECASVLRELATTGESFGVDPSRVAMGGSSAGASVAFGTAIHLGSEVVDLVHALVGIVGLFDFDPDSESMKLKADPPVQPGPAGVDSTLSRYAPTAEARTDPRVNIVGADLSHLPPTFLAAAEIDALRDSSRRLAARLALGGREVSFKQYAGMTHLFFGYSREVERSRECVRDVAAFLGRSLASDVDA